VNEIYNIRVVFTHTGIAAGVGRAFSRVCLSVCPRSITGKPLELSTPNLVHVYCIAVAQHALIQRSKGQRLRSHAVTITKTATVTTDHGPYSAHIYAGVLPAAVAGVGVHVDTTTYVWIVF